MQYGYEEYKFESEEYKIVVEETYEALSDLIEHNLDKILAKFKPPEQERIKKIYEKGGTDILAYYILHSVMDYFLLELKEEVRDILLDAGVYPEELESLFHIFVESHSDIMDRCLYSCLIGEKSIEDGKNTYIEIMKEKLYDDIGKAFSSHDIVFFPANYIAEVCVRASFFGADHMGPLFLTKKEQEKIKYASVLSQPDIAILENDMCCVVYKKYVIWRVFPSKYTDIEQFLDALMELKQIAKELWEGMQKTVGIMETKIPTHFIRENREIILRAQELLFSIVNIEYPENYAQKKIVISEILDTIGLNSEIATILARKV